MDRIDFAVEDFYYLRDLLRSNEAERAAEDADAVTTEHFRQLLLASMDVAPEDPTVQRLAETHLAPITDNPREFARAMHRVCLIERSDGSDATGLLIGRDLLLTAAHVLRGTRGIFADPRNVTVHFDRLGLDDAGGGLSCGLKKHATLDQPVVVASSIRVNEGDQTVIKDTKLDYVLVRLDQSIGEATVPRSGRPRGWINGSRADHEAPNGPDAVTVLQHPGGRDLHYARGHVFNTHQGRIHYSVDVKGGSSGSPILDRWRRIVGIHTGQVTNSERVGTSFRAIFEDVARQRANEVLNGALADEPVFVRPPDDDDDRAIRSLRQSKPEPAEPVAV